MKNNVQVSLVKSHDEYELCKQIRKTVFIEEQGVPENIEVDEYESKAKHFLALLEGKPVATGRVRIKKSYAKFERIATLKQLRGHGVGRLLMTFMQEFSFREFPEYLPAMHAQQDAIPFYLKIGWTAIGEIFYEAEIPHRVLIYPPCYREKIQKLKIWNDSEAREDIRVYLIGLI